MSKFHHQYRLQTELVEEISTEASLKNARLFYKLGYIPIKTAIKNDHGGFNCVLKVTFRHHGDKIEAEHIFKGYDWGLSNDGSHGLLEFSSMFTLKLSPKKILGKEYTNLKNNQWHSLSELFGLDLPNINPTIVSHADLEDRAGFNNVPHLLVDIPDGHFTISARTTQGKEITFAFVPYQTDQAPQCVDVQVHDQEQRVIVFEGGTNAFDYRRHNGKKPTLTTFILTDVHDAE